MKQYLDLLHEIITNGEEKQDRTGTGTKSIFGYQMRFNLQEGFPLVTTKELHLKSIIHELIWFINGYTNIKYLAENKVRIWDDWPYKKYSQSNEFKGESIREFTKKIVEDDTFAAKWGDLGPVYGKQWRRWVGEDKTEVDQLKNLIEQLKNNPDSRRHIISAWNPSDVDQMALPPCHCLFQFYIANNKLSCQLYQRSADVFLGVPFNIASYALLTHMIAHILDLEVGHFVHTLGDAHLYLNHLEQAQIQLERTPYPLPTLKFLKKIRNIEDFRYEDILIENYQYHPKIKAEVAV